MPEKFTDNKEKTYVLTLTLGKTREVRAKLPCDLFNENDWKLLMSSLADRLAYIWWLVADQAREDGISLEQFEQRLIGKGVADGASDAFLAELVNFYRAYDQTKLMTMTMQLSKAMKTERKMTHSDRFEQVIEHAINGAMSSVLQPTQELTGTT